MKKGMSLIELLIAITLLTTVLATASSLLASFRKFYRDFIETQNDIGEVVLTAFEEISNRLLISNEVTITAGTKIDIMADTSDTPADFADDTKYTYRRDTADNTIKYSKDDGTEKVIARNVAALTFELQPTGDSALNRVKMKISIRPQEGGQEREFETTITTRGRSAG